MEFEQIIKQLDWLDEERRKDKATIAAQVEHIAALSTTIDTLKEKVKTLEEKSSDYAALPKRMDQFEDFLAQQREESNENYRELEKKIQKREQEVNKRFQADLAPINEAIAELRSKLDLSDIKRDLKAREKEDLRLSAEFTELKAKFDEVVKSNKDLLHKQEVFEDGRKQYAKRFTDIQGEIVALRKRLDEEREKRQVNADSLKNIENRVGDVLASEQKRKQEQTEFFEKFSLEQIDRERAWKEWMEEADQFNEKTEQLETYLQEADDTTRAAKKAEEDYAEISQKIERRVHEIVEMQRLAEERMRQEWVTFKADDQKRWTGYGLAQDETMKNLQETMEKVEERLTALDDRFQTMQDQMHQTTDATESQMQDLMNWAHEWLTTYQRVMGHTPKES
jgi:DNA repair exonuclease SbcCD ATPase subunit